MGKRSAKFFSSSSLLTVDEEEEEEKRLLKSETRFKIAVLDATFVLTISLYPEVFPKIYHYHQAKFWPNQNERFF